ncbi:bifunctional folylpolyglutamate synthase/dihydrofolate synthase [Rhodospirillaceae bacterium SYSU D60014]|uniref:bifunctional folylpolyglutamate synthase/dihydrofolate synthase n=1 Tax=Virgifigura deserti TaxID=2268457 RepID=UPI000E66E36F
MSIYRSQAKQSHGQGSGQLRREAAQQAPRETSSASDIILDRLNRYHPKIIDLSLDRIERLLAALGNPQRRLPPVVHVAGTNGKGSVIAYLRAMLEAAGYRVHVYTSPHLVRFNERIRLAGRLIEDDELMRLLDECEAANGTTPITYFEITTVAAFLAFARTPADILLLETGLGGRQDATNMVERPLLTVLTPISFDHWQHLGNTLTQIAGEKAGIMKPGVPAVIAPQPDEAAAVFEARARELSVPLCRHGQEWSTAATGSSQQDPLVFRMAGEERRLPLPALIGAHQIENAGTALACLSWLKGFAIDEAAIRRGLSDVQWPARMQRLTQGPLVAMLPPDWELWLDGGHNAAAGQAIAGIAAGWREAARGVSGGEPGGAPEGRPLHLVFGMLETKDPVEFLRPLAPLVRSLHAITIPGEHAAMSAEQAAAAARAVGIEAHPAESISAALSAIRSADEPAGRVLICGSLYLAGSVLGENS